MDFDSKKLSIIQTVGFEERNMGDFSTSQICQVVYDLGQEFLEDMLDTVYSDGPIYFKSYPFSKSNSFYIFTTFGNKISPTGEDTGPLIFEEQILIDSFDFASLPASNLQEYYDKLSTKYESKDLNKLAVYHVLYHSANGLVVDAYSSWEKK